MYSHTIGASHRLWLLDRPLNVMRSLGPVVDPIQQVPHIGIESMPRPRPRGDKRLINQYKEGRNQKSNKVDNKKSYVIVPLFYVFRVHDRVVRFWVG